MNYDHIRLCDIKEIKFVNCPTDKSMKLKDLLIYTGEYSCKTEKEKV